MKKILLTLTLINLIICTQAQVEFCPQGAHWTSAFNSGGFPQSLSYNFMVNTNFQGKDTLNGDSVKVLSSSRFFLNGGHFNNAPIYLKQIGDTVFMNTIYTNNQWQVLFNFGATTGQKWNNTLQPQGGSLLSYTNTVASSQTVIINGLTLKQLAIEQEIEGDWYESAVSYTITERIGSNKHVFSFGGAGNPDGEYFTSNLCYSDDTFGTYYYGGSSCVLTTDIKKYSAESIAFIVYPNPVSNSCQIKVVESVNIESEYDYKISNSLGQLVLFGKIQLFENGAEIVTNQLPSGVYSLELSKIGGTNSVWGKKVLIKMD